MKGSIGMGERHWSFGAAGDRGRRLGWSKRTIRLAICISALILFLGIPSLAVADTVTKNSLLLRTYITAMDQDGNSAKADFHAAFLSADNKQRWQRDVANAVDRLDAALVWNTRAGSETSILKAYYNLLPSASDRAEGFSSCNAITRVLGRVPPALALMEQSGVKLEGALNIKDLAAAEIDDAAISTFYATASRQGDSAYSAAFALPDIKYVAP